MSFKRKLEVPPMPTASQLTSDMVGIGMLFAAEPNYSANIEDTLLNASSVGMDQDDFRVLAILCTWLEVHSSYVNADHLIQIVTRHPSSRVRTFWAAFAQWKTKDRRFARLKKFHRGPRVDLLLTGQDFQIRRHGEDARFVGTVLRVDGKVLRQRSGDVLTPTELASRQTTYRWRIIIGPTYRADLWALLDQNPTSSVSGLARHAHSSIGAAWEAKKDYSVLFPRPREGTTPNPMLHGRA